MLTLSKDSPLVRYAYFTSDRYKLTGPPDTVSLCPLFWRTMMVSAIWLGPTAFVCFMSYDIWTSPPRPVRSTDSGLWWVLALVMAVIAVVAAWDWIERHPNSLIGTIVWAIKRKVCPVVQLTTPGAEPESTEPPNLIELARKLRNAGFLVTELPQGSGDAFTIKSRGMRLAEEARRLRELLQKEPHAWHVWAEYTPELDEATLHIGDLSIEEGTDALQPGQGEAS